MPNQLIDSLPDKVRAAVLAELIDSELVMDKVLWEQGDLISDVYFPDSGMVSIVSSLGNRDRIETGTVGREGMVGIEVYLGLATAPNRTLVQVPGTAHRLPASAFVRLAREHPPLAEKLGRFAATSLAIANRLAACNLVHTLSERCARWLLTVRDNVDTDSFQLTHEYLATMLGVRRAGVTTTMGALTRKGFVISRRGVITILDRAGLETASCDCQAVIRTYYVT